MLTFVLFCGGGNLKNDGLEFKGIKSTLVDELKRIGDVYMYDPSFYFDNHSIKEYQNDQLKYLFDPKDLDIDTHCRTVYRSATKISKQNKLFIISRSRGYMYANVFGKLYEKQNVGYINIDGGKPDNEFEQILKETDISNIDLIDLSKQLKQIKTNY